LSCIYVYGDSWVSGCELARFSADVKNPGDDAPELAFPACLQKLLNINVKNKGITGSSVTTMLYEFLQDIPNSGDTAIFCCSAKTRRMYFTKKGQKKEIQFTVDELLCNEYEDHAVTSRILGLLYLLCNERNIKSYFLNLFDTINLENFLLDTIPDNNWLIPKNQSICSKIFDDKYFNQWDNHHNGNFQQWIESNNALAIKYIRPCDAHPNLEGHENIANYIAKELQKRL
jgi:hypothetical protein